MNLLIGLYRSSVGKKILIGTTGVCLCIYLIVHLAGNLLLFKNDGGTAFNAYAEILPSLLIIRIIEIVLFAIFIGHIFLGTFLWFVNKRARPHAYELNRASENSDLLSRTMIVTGSIILIFLVIHLRQFWGPSRFGNDHIEMFTLVKAAFSDPFYGVLYVVAMVLLGFHLRHGFQSVLQTFGLRNKKFLSVINFIGIFFWFVIPLGFAAMPIYFLLNL
jgi:succinate dehydrogenase / fumarate reductase cytochrome b subunit